MNIQNDTSTSIIVLDYIFSFGIAMLQLCIYHTFSVLLVTQIVRRVPIPQFMQPLFVPAKIQLSPLTFAIDGVFVYFYCPPFVWYVWAWVGAGRIVEWWKGEVGRDLDVARE